MPLDLSTLLLLAPACAPSVAPSTLLAVAQAESGFNPLAIGVNGPKPKRLTFTNSAAAAESARRLIAAGQNIDLGLSQINVRNLASLGLSVETAFDPCRSLAASAQVLEAGFARAAPRPGEEQAGLRTALSYYNTGRPDRGLENGYVARVTAAARKLVPALDVTPARSAPTTPREPPARPPWEVFGGAPSARASFVLSPKPGTAQ